MSFIDASCFRRKVTFITTQSRWSTLELFKPRGKKRSEIDKVSRVRNMKWICNRECEKNTCCTTLCSLFVAFNRDFLSSSLLRLMEISPKRIVQIESARSLSTTNVGSYCKLDSVSARNRWMFNLRFVRWLIGSSYLPTYNLAWKQIDNGWKLMRKSRVSTSREIYARRGT